MSEDSPIWQCVLILWGEKYDVALVNHLIEAVIRTSASKPRFVLISDRPRPELHPSARLVNFDPWYLKPEFLKRSCQAKLVMFEPGIVPEDLPAIYLDLDTAILGDISRALGDLEHPKTVLMLQSVVLPFGWLGRQVYRLTNRRRYARGNSSIVVYRPSECHYIAETFRELYGRYGGIGFRPMIADERFISWVAQMHIKRLPKSLAVKFTNEYMHPLKSWLLLKGSLPWVRRRRDGLAALTFPGPVVKAEELVKFREGDSVRDWKHRWLIWNERALGDMGDRLQAYYAPLVRALEEKG